MVLEPQSIASTTPTNTTQSTHTTPIHTTPTPSTSTQSPLLLLSNMSNLMSIKLDYTNYIPWKHQLITILKAYFLVEHIDGTTPKPSPFVLDAIGNATSVANPEFQAWKIKDKALFSLINSTLTSQVFSLVVGITSSREVWNTLEQRFTSTSRANILNLKLEFQGPKKGNESVNSFLQKIKVARDKFLAVGVIIDNEELIFIVLRGLPREFAHFCSAIRTRSDPITYEQLAIMLQSEEQAMTNHLDSVSHYLAMFAFNGKANSNSQISHRIMYLEEEEGEINQIEEEEEAGTTMVEVSNSFHHKPLIIFLLKILLKASSMNGQYAKFVGNQDIKP